MIDMEVTKNFEWSITKRKVCIFIPNYGKREELVFSINNIQTEVPEEDWVIIVGNDGIDVNLDCLKSKNVYYYTLHRKSNESRNGAFNRNYAIKRCQSEWLIQKDPEVILQGDFIKKVLDSQEGWRAGNVYVLPRGLSKELVQENDFSVLKFSACISIYPVKILDSKYAKYIIVAEDGKPNFSSYFHYAYAMRTRILQEMQGYDEFYLYYGYEDSDMFVRLLAMGQHLIPDNDITAIHLHHERDKGFNLQDLKKMRQVFIAKDPKQIKRNQTWGEGE
jgi:hypothetical protein